MEGVWEEVLEGLAQTEKVMGQKLGDIENPLLLSVRSGAGMEALERRLLCPSVLLTHPTAFHDVESSYTPEVVRAQSPVSGPNKCTVVVKLRHHNLPTQL